jgi:hypothetical protein
MGVFLIPYFKHFISFIFMFAQFANFHILSIGWFGFGFLFP